MPDFTALKSFCSNILRLNREGNALALSAEATYYLILNIVPFLVFLIEILLWFVAPYSEIIKAQVQALPLGLEAVAGEFSSEIELIRDISHRLPFDLSVIVDDGIDRIIAAHHDEFTIVSVVSALLSLWASTQGIAVLVQAAEPKHFEDKPWWEWLYALVVMRFKALVFAFLLVGLIAFTLVGTIFGDTLLKLFQHLVANFPLLPHLSDMMIFTWDIAKFFIPFVWLIFTLTVFYRYAPSYRPSWETTFVTAFVVTLLWLASTVGYNYFMTHWSSLGPLYGSLIGFVMLLAWLRFMAFLIIAGSYVLLAYTEI